MAPSLLDIRLALARHRPSSLPAPRRVRDHAAVALCLAGPPDGLHLCFIRRADREGDPWSGHMAFPGGRAQPEDASARAVAERETAEEVGLGFAQADFLAGLGDISVGRSSTSDAVLSAFVYHMGSTLPSLRLCTLEVAAAFWIPLTHLWDDAHSTSLEWVHEGRALRFSGIAWGEDVVWGLTHRVLHTFATALACPLVAPRVTTPASG